MYIDKKMDGAKQEVEVDRKLATYLVSVVEASEKRESESVRFFIPHCGKSGRDLKFLYDRGFEVIGHEDDVKTCQEFFEKNKLAFKRSGGNPRK